MLGWIASIGAPSADGNDGMAVHVDPPSVERSQCTRQLLGRAGDSVLLPATIVTSLRRTGLFLIGPRMPSGRRRTLVHVRPLSGDVRLRPHHVCGLRPTL